MATLSQNRFNMTISVHEACTLKHEKIIGMDTDRYNGMDHDARVEETRAFLAGKLQQLIEKLEAQIEYDPTAGMAAALIQAYRELGRLYQTSERPGGKGLTEAAVARMLESERARVRAETIVELTSARKALEGSAVQDVREALKALSDKSLG